MAIQISGTTVIDNSRNINAGITTVSAGTAGVPSITPTGDSNTGIFFPSADTIAFSEGGVEAMRVDSSGRMSIGSATALGPKLNIYESGTGMINALHLGSGGGTTGNGASISFGLGNYQDPTVNLLAKIGGIYTGGGYQGALTFSTNANADGTSPQERARIDSSGRLLVGTTSERINVYFKGSALTASTQIENQTNNYNSGLSILNYSLNGYGALLTLGGSASNTKGTNALVAGNAELGYINFVGNDGTNFRSAAIIACEADGTTGAGDMPGRLVFSTTADGSATPTERMRITNAGVLSLSGAPTGFSGQDPVKFGINQNTQGVCIAHIQGSGDNAPGANTYALRITQNVDGGHANSAALRIDHSNPAGGTPGALVQIFGNLGNATTQKLWEVFNYGEQIINRPGSDGALITFQQAQTPEGSISVSGTTVSYNGAHLSRWSQLLGGAERTEILRGTVLSNLDEMCEWIDAPKEAVLWEEGEKLPEGVIVGDIKEPANPGGPQDNEQLNRMKVSEVEGDKNVSGVFQCWDDDDDTYTNDFYCAMTGDFIIRIADGTTVQRGDLLMSAGDGTAKPQDDDIIRSKTVAKVTSTNVTCIYEDGSYCVPCVLMAC